MANRMLYWNRHGNTWLLDSHPSSTTRWRYFALSDDSKGEWHDGPPIDAHLGFGMDGPRDCVVEIEFVASEEHSANGVTI